MKKILLILILSSSLTALFSDAASYPVVKVYRHVYIDNKDELPNKYRLIETDDSIYLKRRKKKGWINGPALRWKNSESFYIEDDGREHPRRIKLNFRISRIYDGPNGPELQMILVKKRVETTWEKNYTVKHGSNKPIEFIKTGVVYIKNIPNCTVLKDKTYTWRYHILSIFDGDPATGWAEGEKDAGMGSSFTVQFKDPIKADSLMVMPGWFQSRFYKKNNRVKQLSVLVNEEEFIFDFDDKMEAQKVSFRKDITFSKITFTLKEYYDEEAKWNDTPIAEIQFFSNGQPLYCFFDPMLVQTNNCYTGVNYDNY